jgi:hypothetical protein
MYLLLHIYLFMHRKGTRTRKRRVLNICLRLWLAIYGQPVCRYNKNGFWWIQVDRSCIAKSTPFMDQNAIAKKKNTNLKCKTQKVELLFTLFYCIYLFFFANPWNAKQVIEWVSEEKLNFVARTMRKDLYLTHTHT